MALRKWFSPSNLMRRSKAAADWGALPKPNENGHRIPSGRCGLILSEILMLLEWMWPTVGHFWILNITIPPILWFGVFLICCFFHRASCDGPIHRCHPISRKTGFSEAKPVIGMSSPENQVFQTNPTFFQGLVGQGIYIYITTIYTYVSQDGTCQPIVFPIGPWAGACNEGLQLWGLWLDGLVPAKAALEPLPSRKHTKSYWTWPSLVFSHGNMWFP